MSLEDQYKLLIGGYCGVLNLDEYELKPYILKDIEEYINHFMRLNPIDDYDYQKKLAEYDKELSLITKLQDALIVVKKINAPIEVTLLLKKKLRILKNQEKDL